MTLDPAAAFPLPVDRGAPVGSPDPHHLARILGLRPVTTRLLINRGVATEAHARRYLTPRLADLRPPDGGEAGAGFAMAGFAQAARRLALAIESGETIGVFGDYDVDGLTTCALLTSFLRSAGAAVSPRVARREAGYGFGPADAEALAADGCTLIVTGDCGTSDFDGIGRANGLGCAVIVVDHHQVPERDPGAFALLNPHQPGCGFPFKGLASVGVAFYLAAAVRTLVRGRRETPDPRTLLDLVAVGTICDMAPLTDENRILVAAGLRELARGARPGLRALCELAGLVDGKNPRPLSAFDVSFKLGPRLNAPGRLGDAQPGLDLLLAPDAPHAVAAAFQLEELNTRRRTLQDHAFGEALTRVDGASERGAVVVAGEGWAHGVMGIVAAKLVERCGVPAAAIALEGGVGRGSVRSTGGVDLYRALSACAPHLVRFGGHAGAAGVTVEAAAVPAFTAAFEAAVAEARANRPASAGADAGAIEAEVELREVDQRLAEELSLLAPFGVGNPEPVLGTRAVLDRSRVVGERHLQITLRDGPARDSRDGIAFGLAARDPGVGARVRVSFLPEMDTFRGERRLRLRVRGLARDGAGGSGPPDQR